MCVCVYIYMSLCLGRSWKKRVGGEKMRLLKISTKSAMYSCTHRLHTVQNLVMLPVERQLSLHCISCV